jgi:hypothetical protein
MPARLQTDERPVIASITILPTQKTWLENRARRLSLRYGKHISVSTIIRTLIDNYAVEAEAEAEANEAPLSEIVG